MMRLKLNKQTIGSTRYVSPIRRKRMSLAKDSGRPIQAMPLGKGFGATSPYTVQPTDNVVEFVEAGQVTIDFIDGTQVQGSVLAGSRYAIPNYVTTITTTSEFNIG